MLVDLATCQKRVIELLLAAGRGSRYAAAVADQKRYAVLQEITDAVLDADMAVCADIIDTPGHPFKNTFVALSAAVAHGGPIPAHIGSPGAVTVELSSTYALSKQAKSRDDVLELVEFPTLFGPSRWHFVEDGRLYHNGTAAKVYTADFTRTGACQAHVAYQPVVICEAVANLPKDGGDLSFFEFFAKQAARGRALIRSRAVIVPDVQAYAREAA